MLEKIFRTKQIGIRKNLYFLNFRICSWKLKKINVMEYVKSLGVKLGENVTFITLPNTQYPYSYPIFTNESFLVEIGDNSIVSFNCTFVTHDGSIGILKRVCPQLNEDIVTYGKIKIGQNCFIGCHTTILPNVTIGNNSIIGAGSVVTKSIPEGEVWAGCPAKFIRKTSELAQKYYEANFSEEMQNLKKYYNQEYEKLR